MRSARWKPSGSRISTSGAFGSRAPIKSVPIADLIKRLGPAPSLVMIARRARCKTCRQLGAHVQPSRPDTQSGQFAESKLSAFSWARKAS